ncbi:alpha/beta hydrolase, partial [Spirillospora sp. NPDC049652]
KAGHAIGARAHDSGRARAMAGFLSPGRHFLSFDARGSGRAVEVVGDLANADRVAVVVPGADGLLTNFDSWKWAGGGARSVADQARREAPGIRLAVVAWLGYASPSTRGDAILTDGRARTAATALRGFVNDLHHLNGRAGIALLCHSYGTVVCGRAGRSGPLPVDEVALYGSPGTTANSADQIFPSAQVWAGRSSGDWTRFVPHLRVFGVGFGRDPVSTGFGARRFDAGSGPHSAYLKPGSTALTNLTRIALHEDPEVTHG